MAFPSAPEKELRELIDLRDKLKWSWPRLARHFGNKSHNAPRKRYYNAKKKLSPTVKA